MQIRRQRDASGLEDSADLAGTAVRGVTLAVLFDGCLLETVEIAQQVGPFDGEAMALAVERQTGRVHGDERQIAKQIAGRSNKRSSGRSLMQPRHCPRWCSYSSAIPSIR